MWVPPFVENPMWPLKILPFRRRNFGQKRRMPFQYWPKNWTSLGCRAFCFWSKTWHVYQCAWGYNGRKWYGGFLKVRGYPQSSSTLVGISMNFPCKPSSYGGIPMTMETIYPPEIKTEQRNVHSLCRGFSHCCTPMKLGDVPACSIWLQEGNG